MCPFRVSATQSSNELISAINVDPSQLDKACASHQSPDDPLTCGAFLEWDFGNFFGYRGACRSPNVVRV